MGFPTRDLPDETIVSQSPTDALLFSTVCIVGLPVDVQVKDGSVYSGILHTACFDRDYGIVLKKAKMIKKGKKDANLAKGTIVDTLVVLSSDLVQIVAKGLLLPADGIIGKVSGEDIEAVNRLVQPSECPAESELKTAKSRATFESKTKQISVTRSFCQNECNVTCGVTKKNVEDGFPTNAEKESSNEEVASKLTGIVPKAVSGEVNGIHSAEAKIDEASKTTVNEGQVEEETSQGESKGSEALKNDYIHEDQCFTAGDSNPSLLKYDNEMHVDISSKTSSNGASCGSHVPSCIKPDGQNVEKSTSTNFSSFEVPASEISNSSSAVVNVSSQSCTSRSVSPAVSLASKGSVSSTVVKEFKLNPGAQTFFPVFSIPRSATPPPVTTVASMAYIQNSPPLIPVAVAQPEIGINPFAPRSSLPMKFVPYNTLVALNGDNGPQYPQPIVGRGGSMPQPVRYAGQYNPVQAGPGFVHPNSQPVMVGRLGQLVYMNPISHDVIQGSTPLPQVSARPLLTSQVPLLKQQGATNQAVPVCVTQPHFVGGLQQPPYAVASQIPFSQPPFPAVRPIAVPSANGPFGSKFI